MNDYIPPPMSHRQILVVFSALMLGMLLAALDQTILGTALPTIVGDLGGLQHLSWVITSYLLAATASVPLYGKFSDLFGRKRLFQFAIITFLVGSMASGLSQSMLQLIIFRGIQGLGAGGLMALSQAIIGDILLPRERARYIGYMGVVFALASVVGPLLGGLFTDHLSWRWVFYINLPLGLIALIVASRVLNLPVQRREAKIDFIGAILMVGGVTCILLATTWGGNEYAWGSATIVGLFAAGIAMTVLFVLQELRAPEPILPLHLVKNRTFSVSGSLGFMLGFAMFGAIAFLPLFLQVVKGATATESGLRMLPMMVGVVSMSIISGRIISRTGKYRIFPIMGTALVTLGFVLLYTVEPETSFVLLSVYLVVFGIGLGLVMQVITLIVQNAVDYRDLGTATAGVNFFRSMGGAFGVAVFGSVLANRLDYNLPRFIPAERLNDINAEELTSSPEQLRLLPPDVLQGVVEAFSRSLETVFLIAIPFSITAFVLACMLKELPMRTREAPGVSQPGKPATASEHSVTTGEHQSEMEAG